MQMDPTKKRKLEENGIVSSTTDLDFPYKLTPQDARKMMERFTPDQLLDILQNAVVRHPDILDAVRSIADPDATQRKLFIRGLGWETTTENLRNLFSTYGELEEAVVILDKNTGKSKGYGFVIYKHVDGALLALKEPSKKIDGRVTVTQLAIAGNSGANNNNNSSANPGVVDVAMRKIYVANVPYEMPSDKLLNHFAQYGEIEEGPLGFDKQTGKSKGFALFVYKTAEGAQAALLEPVKMIEGRQLNCKLAIDGKRGRQPGGSTSKTSKAKNISRQKMSVCLFNSPPTLSLPTPAKRTLTSILDTSSYWTRKTLLGGAITGALSINLLLSSPSLLALESPSPSLLQSQSTEYLCREEETQQDFKVESEAPQVVTNEGIVEEAWEIVNDSFLDSGRRRWTPQSWQQKREDILNGSIQSRAKAHDIIRRMLASLGDPYTRFLSPAEFSKMGRYDISGIGINLREIPDENGEVKLKVLGLLLDGPAYSAGVRQGDELLSVNGEDVKGKSAFEVLSLLQGPNETFVTIKVKHGNCGPVHSIEVQRQLVARTPVFYRLEQIENSTASAGYIRLREFNALARKDLVIAMKRLQDRGASYFILDLRDNLGGLVQAGIEISKLFLNEGEKVIYTVGRDPQYQNTIVADSAPLVKAPVIVLVNNKTASASEIVASALHDNCRAVLVGERTFGKGLIQSVFELHDGSGVVVTVGKYVTPNHMDINGNGIEPDYQNFPGWSDVKKHLSECNINRQG